MTLLEKLILFIIFVVLIVGLYCGVGWLLNKNSVSEVSQIQGVYCYISPEMSMVMEGVEVNRESSNTYSIKKDNLILTVPVDKCIIKSLTTESK